jgi:hypothetical protein
LERRVLADDAEVRRERGEWIVCAVANASPRLRRRFATKRDAALGRSWLQGVERKTSRKIGNERRAV